MSAADFCVTGHAIDQFLERGPVGYDFGGKAPGWEIENLVLDGLSRSSELIVQDNNGVAASIVHLGSSFDPPLYAVLKPNTTRSKHKRAVVSILTDEMVSRSVSVGGKWHDSVTKQKTPGVGLLLWAPNDDDGDPRWERYPSPDRAVARANKLLEAGRVHPHDIEIYQRVELEETVRVTVDLKEK